MFGLEEKERKDYEREKGRGLKGGKLKEEKGFLRPHENAYLSSIGY